MLPRFRTRRGATLVEMMTVAGSFLLLLVGLVTVGVNAGREWANGSSRLIADNDASVALQKLAADIRAGIRASVSSTNDELTVVFPATNSEGDYDRYTTGPSVRYFLSNGNLCRQQGTNPAQVVARKIQSVWFAVNGTQIEVRIQTRQQVGTQRSSTTLRTQVTLRNEPL